MSTDLDQYLNRLVVAALTVFVVVSLMLAAFVARQIWLQQRVVELSSSLQTNLEELEQTTEEIQSKMSELESPTVLTPEAQDWDDVNTLLEDVDQQLESIGETIDDVAVASEEELGVAPLIASEDEAAGSADEAGQNSSALRTQADQVFTIFAVLTGIAAIAISILLAMALRAQENRQSV